MALTYAEYLQLDRLLTLQQPRSNPAEHDEMLFIVIHQVYELWFAEMLHELSKVKADFSANDLYGALHTLKRVRMILKTAVGQLDILEPMTPVSFSSFRDRLETASGFQSVQYRELEFVLGYKRPQALRWFENNPPALAALQKRLNERSLIDHLYDFLACNGTPIPESLRTRDLTQPNEPNEQVQEGLLTLYKTRPDVGLLLETLTDIDEGLQEWRYRHVKLVERTIGNKTGTGGSMGVDFLKQTLFKPLFPDLWAIRHRL